MAVLRGGKGGGGVSLHIDNFENLFLPNRKTYSSDIWYVASSGGPLSRLYKLLPQGQNWPVPGRHKFNIGSYSEKFKNLLLRNRKA